MRRLILIVAFLFLSSAFVACTKGFTFRQATGNMLPTVQIGDTLFCDPFYYSHSPVERGHIVLIFSPDKQLSDAAGKDTKFMFRIVGVGGDKVQIKEGRVFVNGESLGGAFATGRYPSDEPVEDFGPVVVPPDEYFLLGDNLPESADSRYWSRPTIKKDLIYGRVTLLQDGKTGETREL
jgi:signal peptidase I